MFNVKMILAGIAMMTVAISSCDEDTTTMGNSLTNSVDKFAIVTDTFEVSTRSIISDSVLSRSAHCYLGRIKDPEAGSYITSDYMTQFALLENEATFVFAPKDSLAVVDEQGECLADSCALNVVISSYIGDSLTAMKMTVTELETPVKDNQGYYTSFDIEKQGYLRKDGIRKNKVYAISDLLLSDSVRNMRRSGSYFEYVTIPLNDPYTDKEGKTYNNYGTYLLQNYYKHPEYYKNSFAFAQHLCPGFYFQTTDGLGLMAEIERTQLVVYYSYRMNGATYSQSKAFTATSEVLQTNHFTSNKENKERLASKDDCTYLKTPDGIFTEVTLPIEKIKQGHENDSITSARITFNRMNDLSELSDDLLKDPTYLLMIERDSLYTFFEHRNLPNNINSYLASLVSSQNSYTFNNISGLVNHMYANRNKSENWNKAVLVPVDITTTSSSSSTTTSTVNNEMRVTSVRLVGGSNNRHQPIRISVVYNKNK